jgi:glutathione peroxidase
MQSIYDVSVKTIDGREISMNTYRGQVLLIVNVASRCSFTVQYKELEALYRRYHDQGFEILGFPCNQFLYQEPGSESDIKEFCSRTYDVSFPMFSKIDVNGPNTHPLYQILKASQGGWLGVRRIGWNFIKFLVDRRGEVAERFSSFATPEQIEPKLRAVLAQPRG